MTREPVRWLESSQPSELLALMRVGAEELAPPDVLARVEARLRAPELARADSAAQPSAAPPGATALGWSSGLRVKGVGLVLLLGAAGLMLYPLVRSTAPADAPVRSSSAREQALTTPADAQRTLPASPTPAPSANAAPPPVTSLDRAPSEPTPGGQAELAAEPRRARLRSSARSSEPRAQPIDARLAEARLLEQARRELAAQPGRALVLLREHAAQFPESWLEEEREAMLIRALAQTGQGAAASQQLAHFRTRFPHSVHTRLLDHALEQALAPR